MPTGGSIDRRAAFPLQRSERSLSHLTNGQRVVHRQLINGVQYSGADQSVILIMQALRPYPDQNPGCVCGRVRAVLFINILVTIFCKIKKKKKLNLRISGCNCPPLPTPEGTALAWPYANQNSGKGGWGSV